MPGCSTCAGASACVHHVQVPVSTQLTSTVNLGGRLQHHAQPAPHTLLFGLLAPVARHPWFCEGVDAVSPLFRRPHARGDGAGSRAVSGLAHLLLYGEPGAPGATARRPLHVARKGYAGYVLAISGNAGEGSWIFEKFLEEWVASHLGIASRTGTRVET